MKILLCTGFLLVGSYLALAQKSTIIRVKDGEVANKVVPFSERYRYPEFLQGSLTYISGNIATAKFNYNVLLGEMQMIAPTKDTLSLANEQAIKRITIGEDIFYYDLKEGYLEVTDEYAPLQLAVNQKYKVLRAEKTGGYNQSTATSAITNINRLSGSNGQAYKLAAKGDLILSKDVTYFLIDQNKQIHPMNRGNVMRLFSKHKKTLSHYLNTNKVSYSNEQELKQLVEFCSQLK